MLVSVFDYRDYKIYLTDWLTSRSGKGRGEKSKIATALNCHTAYITHIFKGHAHLSPEQAADLSAYLGHRADEQRFFMLLVQLARAGNRGLSTFLDQEIRNALEVRMDLKNRLHYQKQLTDQDQAQFYGAWYYLAIYAMVSRPGTRRQARPTYTTTPDLIAVH